MEVEGGPEYYLYTCGNGEGDRQEVVASVKLC